MAQRYIALAAFFGTSSQNDWAKIEATPVNPLEIIVIDDSVFPFPPTVDAKDLIDRCRGIVRNPK
jgi:hypothetical protein